MKIGIMGSGGLGGYYGGMLARAGHEVTFVARGSHLEALRTHGLRVKSVHGDFELDEVHATDSPAEAGIVELILFCTKAPQTEAAAQAALPMVGPDTLLVSLQNGVESAERIGAVVGQDHVLGGATWISSAIEAPGVIRQVSQFRHIVIGELEGGITPRAEAMARVLGDSGAAVEVSDAIQRVIWTKFVFIAAMSGVGALTRLPIGAYRSVPETREMLVTLMREVVAVAGASGVDLEADVIAGALGVVDNAAPYIKPSMQRDVELGRPSELESMIGVIGRKGHAQGVATPVADVVYAALLPVELAARAQRHGDG
jgi:2-dehydropantoate 2-reductase